MYTCTCTQSCYCILYSFILPLMTLDNSLAKDCCIRPFCKHQLLILDKLRRNALARGHQSIHVCWWDIRNKSHSNSCDASKIECYVDRMIYKMQERNDCFNLFVLVMMVGPIRGEQKIKFFSSIKYHFEISPASFCLLCITSSSVKTIQWTANIDTYMYDQPVI